jgi:ankyrin repeat protein
MNFTEVPLKIYSILEISFTFETRLGLLMLASQNGHTEALALLLANGADVNAAKQVIQNLFTISHEFY